MKALCVSYISNNIILPVDNYPVEGSSNTLNKIISYLNPVAESSIFLSKWGFESYIVGLLGDDYEGNTLYQNFINNNVSVEYLVKYNNVKTDSCYIVKNNSTNSKTSLSIKSAKIHNLIDIDIHPSIIILDQEEYLTSLKLIEDNPLALTIFYADSVSDESLRLASLCKYLICSKGFVEEYLNTSILLDNRESLINNYDDISLKFKNTVIFNFEGDGTFTKIDGNYFLTPSIKSISFISKYTSAYISSVAYFLSKNYPLKEVIRLATIASVLQSNLDGDKVITIEEVLEKGEANDII